MITEKDLEEAIAECQGQRNPNANTCIKLAAFYIIKQYMFENNPPQESYSYSAFPDLTQANSYYSETEFGQLASTLPQDKLLKIIDELMTTIQVLNPKLYDAVLRKMGDF